MAVPKEGAGRDQPLHTHPPLSPLPKMGKGDKEMNKGFALMIFFPSTVFGGGVRGGGEGEQEKNWIVKTRPECARKKVGRLRHHQTGSPPPNFDGEICAAIPRVNLAHTGKIQSLDGRLDWGNIV